MTRQNKYIYIFVLSSHYIFVLSGHYANFQQILPLTQRRTDRQTFFFIKHKMCQRQNLLKMCILFGLVIKQRSFYNLLCVFICSHLCFRFYDSVIKDFSICFPCATVPWGYKEVIPLYNISTRPLNNLCFNDLTACQWVQVHADRPVPINSSFHSSNSKSVINLEFIL